MHTPGTPPPVVLDIDGSVLPLGGERIIALRDWQEQLRFACSHAGLRRFAAALEQRMPARHGTVLLGSGDFHHLSYPLLWRLDARHTSQLVVLDNHPDNMLFPWGVHCGSWVKRVAMHPAVSHVHVAGITSQDIGAAHAWENQLVPLRAGKLTYWSCGVDTSWAGRKGLGQALRSFDDLEALTQALSRTLSGAPQPTYLSIDKDVFATDVVQTNWDQGQMREEQAAQIIQVLTGQMAGSDISGDISSWRYATWWKRLLSAGDGQDIQIDAAALAVAQAGQNDFTERLLARLERCHRAPLLSPH